MGEISSAEEESGGIVRNRSLRCFQCWIKCMAARSGPRKREIHMTYAAFIVYRGLGSDCRRSILLIPTLTVGIQSPVHSFPELILFRMLAANRRLLSVESSSACVRTSLELQSSNSSRP